MTPYGEKRVKTLFKRIFLMVFELQDQAHVSKPQDLLNFMPDIQASPITIDQNISEVTAIAHKIEINARTAK